MNKRFAGIALLILALSAADAQTKVLGYPFPLEKGLLAHNTHEACFWNNPGDSTSVLIVRDNKKADYVWLGKAFGVIGKFTRPVGQTPFKDAPQHFIGGTVKGSEFHFVFQGRNGFTIESADLQSGQFSARKLPDLSAGEKVLAAFCDNNSFYLLAADDLEGTLILHIVDNAGTVSRHPFAIGFPRRADKPSLSEYFRGMQVIRTGEEPDLAAAISGVKVFSRPADIRIVVNHGDAPGRIFSINLASLTENETTADYSPLLTKADRGRTEIINSYLNDGHLFSLILNKKSIGVAVHDANSGKMVKVVELRKDADFGLLAEQPVTETRMGKQIQTKDIEDLRMLIHALNRGGKGLIVSQEPGAKMVITAGSLGMIPPSGKGLAVITYSPNLYFIPDNSFYKQPRTRYYQSSYFRMLLDPTGFAPARGPIYRPVAEQVKDYIDDTGKRSDGVIQFSVGKDQYYGFYDEDQQQYLIEQIRIF